MSKYEVVWVRQVRAGGIELGFAVEVPIPGKEPSPRRLYKTMAEAQAEANRLNAREMVKDLGNQAP